MRGSLFDDDEAAVSARCGEVSRALAGDARPLSRSSVVDGIDKLAAVFVGIDDRRCKWSNELWANSEPMKVTPVGNRTQRSLFAMRWLKCVGVRTKACSDCL